MSFGRIKSKFDNFLGRLFFPLMFTVIGLFITIIVMLFFVSFFLFHESPKKYGMIIGYTQDGRQVYQRLYVKKANEEIELINQENKQR